MEGSIDDAVVGGDRTGDYRGGMGKAAAKSDAPPMAGPPHPAPPTRTPNTEDYEAPADHSWELRDEDEMTHWCRAWAGSHVTAGDCGLCACPPCLEARAECIAWVRENIPTRMKASAS